MGEAAKGWWPFLFPHSEWSSALQEIARRAGACLSNRICGTWWLWGGCQEDPNSINSTCLANARATGLVLGLQTLFTPVFHERGGTLGLPITQRLSVRALQRNRARYKNR